MADEKKYLDKTGLTNLVGKIKSELSKKANTEDVQPKGEYATLVDGTVPASQLPSYVDDVVEFSGFTLGEVSAKAMSSTKTSQDLLCRVQYVAKNNVFVFYDGKDFYSNWGDANTWGTPTTGTFTGMFTTGGRQPESGKIYVDTTTGKTYRWSGSSLVEISASLALGETSETAFAGDRGVAVEKSLETVKSELSKKANAEDVESLSNDVKVNTASLEAKSVTSISTKMVGDVLNIVATKINGDEATSYVRPATTGTTGLMSAEDKNKLDNTIFEEDKRQIAEKSRVETETSRVAAEQSRVRAENERDTNEDSRVSAEQTREQSFTAKVGEVDTAIKNCNTATEGAEKVDATITEANVLQVTDRNGTQKTLDLAAVAKANSVAEDVEYLKETTDTLNGIDNRDISTEYKLEDYRIWRSKEGDFSLNSWSIFNCQGTGWKSKAFPKMDISDYDSVEVSAIINGGSMSTSTQFCGGLHVFVNGEHKLLVNTPQTYTIYPQQLKKNDSDEVVMLLSVQSGVTPYIKVNKKGIAAKSEDVEKISSLVNENKANITAISDTLNGIDNRDISTEYKLEDYRIWRSKEGDFSLNSWSIFNCQGTGWKSKAFPKMDISDYDSVEVSAIINGGSMSTSTQFCGGLHVFVNGEHKLLVNTPQTYTIYPQQLKKNDSDEVVMLLSVQSGVTPYIKVNKKGTTESKDKNISKIVICGDSLCGNKSALIVKELNSILTKYSYALIPRTMGGENMIGNLTRAGGLPIRVAEDFTIPADKTQTNIKLLSGWMNSKGVYASNPYTSISENPHNVKINGIEGNLQKIVAYGMCTYDSNKKFIKYYTAYPINQTTDNNVAYVRFCANNPQVGETHITIGGEAQDVNTLLSLDGSLDYKGTYQENSAFKTSDFIAVNNTTIYADALAVSDTYTFIRNEEGTAIKCGKFNIGFDSALYNDQDAVHIWFTGQNGGYDTDEEWAEMIEQAARNFGEKFIVCSTALDRTTNSLVYAAQRKFGKRYLNLRDYTQNQAVYDGQRFGLIDSSKVASDYSTLFWGSDKVHQNNLLSYLWSVKMWNMIIDFGWMKGERVEDGSLYVK